MQRYESYKSSAIPWIDELPQHWGEEKGKWLHRFRKDLNNRKQCDNVLSLTLRGVVNNDPDDPEGLVPKDYGTYQIFEKDDLVFKLIDLENFRTSRVGLVHERGIMSPAYLRVQPGKEHNPRYFYYYYFTLYQQGIYNKLGAGVRSTLGPTDLLEIGVPVPRKDEQDRIVAFLDQKTAEIDAAITKKERLIELLEEQRHTLISRAVTCGLNPDVALQENNCEWLGTTPAHWKIQKIKYCSKIFRGKFTHRPRNDPRLYDGPYPFIQTGDVARAGKFITEFKQTLNERGLRVSTLIPKGTVVLTIAANVGDISILGFDACFPDSVVGFLPDSELERDYFYLALSVMKRQFIASSIQNTQMNLNVDRIGSNSIAIPPLPEQRAIIKWADEITGVSEAVKTKLADEICALRALKSTVVANAVTGSLKV